MQQAPRTTVEIDPNLFTIVIQFQIDAAAGDAFVHDLTDAVGRTIVKLPGFRSSVFQISSDNTRVINYAQWDSNAVYNQSMATRSAEDDLVGPVIKRHGARVLHSDTYTVVTTFSSS